MEHLMDTFDNINTCLECSKPIKIVKLNYIKDKIQDISDEKLLGFKYCSKCKRTAKIQK